tara:strand:+ start:638 stop:1033 length:396 start_codon:yes stop_codon:yes gene_type:complete
MVKQIPKQIPKKHNKVFKWTKRKNNILDQITQNTSMLFITLYGFEIMVIMGNKSAEKTLEWFVNLNINKSDDLITDLYEYAYLNKDNTYWNNVFLKIKSNDMIKLTDFYDTVKHFADPDGSFGKWKFVTLE